MADNNLEALLAKCVETRDKNDFAVMMESMEKANVFIPAIQPKKITPKMQEAIKAGKPMPVDVNNQPQVCLLKQTDGETVFPIFSSKDHIPKEKTPQALMVAPFKSVVGMVKSSRDKISKIVINPFTQGITLNETIIDMADRRFKAQAQMQNGNGPKTVQVTEKQFHSITHNAVARETLPALLFKDSKEAISNLRLKKEQYILEAYKSRYTQDIACPYTEDDLAVMMLQIEENFLIVRIDMPEANMIAGGPARVYITSDNDSVRYFIITKSGKEASALIIEISDKGVVNELTEAPDNGAEIETIMSFVRPS